MPTYVYRFVDTGETIEVQQSFTDAALTEATHPGTGEVLPVKKVFTPVGVTFKGGGFYKTDSRGKSLVEQPVVVEQRLGLVVSRAEEGLGAVQHRSPRRAARRRRRPRPDRRG